MATDIQNKYNKINEKKKFNKLISYNRLITIQYQLKMKQIIPLKNH